MNNKKSIITVLISLNTLVFLSILTAAASLFTASPARANTVEKVPALKSNTIV